MDHAHALKIAEAQRQNQAAGLPLDYGAILKGRKALPSLFKELPDNAECHRQLLALGLLEWDDEVLIDSPEPMKASTRKTR